MPVLDLEHIGRPDPQDKPLDMVAECACGCGEMIHFGDRGVWRDGKDYYVNSDHLAKHSGAECMDFEWS